MPDLVEQMYCSQQITVPPNLPTILKKYAKAAIRTQPRDLLVWSAYYFKALTYGIPLPVKDRLEYPPVKTISGLSPGFIKILINQLGNDAIKVDKTLVIDYWAGVCLCRDALEEIFEVGGFGAQINWLKFIAICTGYLETCLTRTMLLLCELLTEEPPGGSAHLPVGKFLYLYKFLARLECGPEEPKKPLSPNFLQDTSSVPEISPIETISISDEDKTSGSKLSWQSVLKRMGRRESDKSIATLDLDKEYNKDDTLSRGIAWKQINEYGESSQTSEISLSDNMDSNMGLQVFECHQDKLKRKKVHHIEEDLENQESEDEDVKKKEIKGTEDDQTFKSAHEVNKTKEETSLLREVGERSLNEMLEHMQDYEVTQNIKEAAEDSDEEIIKSVSSLTFDDLKPASSNFQKCTLTPPTTTETSHRFGGEDKEQDKDNELKVLLKRDSSTILIPTPPRKVDEYKNSIEDIRELEEEEDKLSYGEPLGKRVAISLFDVRVPVLHVPTLMKVEEKEVPKKVILEQKWVPIPGIGPKVSEEQITKVKLKFY